MMGWLRRLMRRYPPPTAVTGRRVPVVDEVPETITAAKQVRRRAEALLNSKRGGPLEGDLFGERRREARR